MSDETPELPVEDQPAPTEPSQISIQVIADRDNRQIVVQFGAVLNRIQLTPKAAVDIANALVGAARAIQATKIIVPGRPN